MKNKKEDFSSSRVYSMLLVLSAFNMCHFKVNACFLYPWTFRKNQGFYTQNLQSAVIEIEKHEGNNNQEKKKKRKEEKNIEQLFSTLRSDTLVTPSYFMMILIVFNMILPAIDCRLLWELNSNTTKVKKATSGNRAKELYLCYYVHKLGSS